MTPLKTDNTTGDFLYFEDISVNANGHYLIENITGSIPAGGNTVLIGPNGAGKTTFLHCLTGECKFTGRILFNGTKGRLRIGYVPQQIYVDSSLPLRVDEFIASGLQFRPIWLGISRKIENRLKWLLELTGSEKLCRNCLGKLSGGELRRVLLAAALSRKPDLLILDEPEAGVDVQGERQFWETIEKLRLLLGLTVIMVSHNISMVAKYATKVICINKVVMEQGQPSDVLTPETLSSLFGIPINLYTSCGEKTQANLPQH